MEVKDRVHQLVNMGIRVNHRPRLYSGEFNSSRVIFSYEGGLAHEILGRPKSRRIPFDHPLFKALVLEVGEEGLAKKLVGEPNDDGKIIIKYNTHVIIGGEGGKEYLYSFDLPSLVYRRDINES